MSDYDGVHRCQRCNAPLKSTRDYLEGECLHCRCRPAANDVSERITELETEVANLKTELEKGSNFGSLYVEKHRLEIEVADLKEKLSDQRNIVARYLNGYSTTDELAAAFALHNHRPKQESTDAE